MWLAAATATGSDRAAGVAEGGRRTAVVAALIGAWEVAVGAVVDNQAVTAGMALPATLCIARLRGPLGWA